MQNTPTQSSKLLSLLFEHLDEGQLVTVLHVGPALPETVTFFSDFRCKLHFVDIFSELPIVEEEDSAADLQTRFQDLLQIPSETLFDICLFWDIFNFLNAEAMHALLDVLHPHLRKGSLAHAFSVHNSRVKQANHLYGIQQADTLTFRDRRSPLTGYAPHSQRQLKEMLHCFSLERTVLLADSRLEVLLQAKL